MPARLRRPRSEVLLLLFLLVVVTGLELLRQPGIPSWNSIWQEDGAIFFTEAWNEPFLSTLWDPYNSYLHLAPRLIAAVVTLLPLKAAALGMSLGASMVVAALGIYVFHASGAVFRSTWARVVLAVMIVFLPAAGYEANANIANLHWYLVYASFWVLLKDPRTRGGIALGALITGMAALSDPLVALILPLVVRRAFEHRRELPRLVIPATFAVCLAIQLVIGVFQEQTGRNATSDWGEVPGIYALRVAGSALVGDAQLGRLWNPLGYWFAYGALAVILAVLVYGFLKADRPQRWFIGESLVYSVASAVIPLMLRGTENFLDRANYSLNGSRYTILPLLFLVGALVAVFDAPDRRLSRLGWRNVQIAAAAFFAATLLTSFGVWAVRSPGPRWTGQITWAKQECAKRDRGENADPLWNLPRAPGERATPYTQVRIPISPYIPLGDGRADVPFAVAIPCRDLP